MSPPNQADRKLRTLEQHWQTLLLGTITAVLFFAAKTLWDSNGVQAAMLAKIENLTTQVAKLEGAVGAMQTNYVSRPEFAVHEQRIQSLESKK